MLVVGCIPNFSSERFVGRVAGTGACSVRFWLAFLSSFSFLSDAYVSFPYTTTSIPLT
jgi:hypothetical protein